MTNGKVPPSVQKTLDWICQKYQQDMKKVLKYYWSMYNNPDMDKKFDKSDKGISARHEWTRRMIRADFETRPATETKTVIFYGLGGVSVFNNRPSCRLWVYDTKQKKKACITLQEDVLKLGILDELALFQKYDNIELAPTSEGWMTLDDRSFPLPDPEPVMVKGALLSPEQILQNLKVRVIRQSDLADYKNWSRRTSDGKGWIHSDIVCVEDVILVRASEQERDHNGWKYKNAYFLFGDQSTEGFTMEDGTEVPAYIRTYPNNIHYYPAGTRGNIYGSFTKKQSGDLAFTTSYFVATDDWAQKEA